MLIRYRIESDSKDKEFCFFLFFFLPFVAFDFSAILSYILDREDCETKQGSLKILLHKLSNTI